MRDPKNWADVGGGGGGGSSSSSSSSSVHCILFVDDSIAEHLDDGFEGFNCVRVLFTRGVKEKGGGDDV
jgi:hypothetical protein